MAEPNPRDFLKIDQRVLPDGAKGGVGPVREYLRDAYNARPETTRVDVFTFEATISGMTGQPINVTPTLNLDPEYVFILRRLFAFVQEPGVRQAEIPQFRFNIRDQGRSYSLFRTPINFAQLVGVSGPVGPLEWDGFYVFPEASQLYIEFSSRLPIPVAPVPDRVIGVTVIGDTLRTRLLGG